ncbi:Sec-independent protein translocase subunit TatA/TatB [Candidatus Poriferisodalis sp.]|uniref:Sec-independent protein translocase subunit TatA/TatB n=1 Tax=Candidatus Poriferisodalis sp. TaxID=3101277 RepID=UPI003B02B9B6
MSLQPNEVLIIALVALIVLGPKRLPGAIRSIGRAFRQVREFSTNVRQEMDATLSPPIVETTTPTQPDSDAEASGTPARPVDDAEAPGETVAEVPDRPTSDGAA